MVKISSLLDPKTGKVTRKAPRCLTAKQSAVVEVNKIKTIAAVSVYSLQVNLTVLLVVTVTLFRSFPARISGHSSCTGLC